MNSQTGKSKDRIQADIFGCTVTRYFVNLMTQSVYQTDKWIITSTQKPDLQLDLCVLSAGIISFLTPPLYKWPWQQNMYFQ